ncbi:MAG: cysteine--tRNA ligase [Candidatus Babeliales bacterium]
MILLTNTMTGIKETFVPLHDKQVRMYVCGITPYDKPHVGHGRVYVTFDLLMRVLKASGYAVTYCRNFTDIDDKLINRARAELNDPLKFSTIANTYIAAFHHDIDALNCERPTFEPRVTDHIPEIIAFIQTLVAKRHAYVIDGDVYFSIDSFPAYARLSKQKLADLHAGARVETNDKKENPLDFALWKSEQPDTFWQSPWGYGRPGWHIECSALAYTLLGKQIDIHGGGMDLIFPHHENEIAQTESCTDLPFAQYWMHVAFVRIEKEKMSKSLGNFYTLEQVFQTYDPTIIRYYYLAHHYRVPLDFAFADIDAVAKSYARLVKLFEHTPTTDEPLATQHPLIRDMLAFLADDLNSPGMFGLLFGSIETIQSDEPTRVQVKKLLQTVLGLTLAPLAQKTVTMTPEIEKLIAQRQEARAQKDFKKADALRDQLKALGVDVSDDKIIKK